MKVAFVPLLSKVHRRVQSRTQLIGSSGSNKAELNFVISFFFISKIFFFALNFIFLESRTLTFKNHFQFRITEFLFLFILPSSFYFLFTLSPIDALFPFNFLVDLVTLFYDFFSASLFFSSRLFFNSLNNFPSCLLLFFIQIIHVCFRLLFIDCLATLNQMSNFYSSLKKINIRA